MLIDLTQTDKSASSKKSFAYQIGTTTLFIINTNCLSIETFEQVLPASIINEATTRFKSPKRIIEWLAARLIVAENLGNHVMINYDAFGKPYLNDNNEKHISISHTKNLVIMAYDLTPLGIDLEEISTKVLNVADKFLSNVEKQMLNNTESQTTKATELWCCKEAIYKLVNIKNLSIKDGINLCQVENNLYFEETHHASIQVFQIETYVLALAKFMP